MRGGSGLGAGRVVGLSITRRRRRRRERERDRQDRARDRETVQVHIARRIKSLGERERERTVCAPGLLGRTMADSTRIQLAVVPRSFVSGCKLCWLQGARMRQVSCERRRSLWNSENASFGVRTVVGLCSGSCNFYYPVPTSLTNDKT